MKTTSLIGYCIDRKPVLQVFTKGAQDLVKNWEQSDVSPPIRPNSKSYIHFKFANMCCIVFVDKKRTPENIALCNILINSTSESTSASVYVLLFIL